ncbi:TATA-binding protein-associated factor [Nematocida sp. LUAm3]|nr:TATA-binding protein-associated factor [Nematocida sp. LUAm3]KAI5175322.1 TATA-binding protein-associated factor [Nematocida sp. LUAm2]KAI5177721.1 TATA-binding protein-associated factor [Nematocida sp. LUAm1]
MTSITKLFKALKDSSGKGAKKHITHEITTTYCSTPALLNILLTEAFALSESLSWEDRVSASRIVEEMARTGSICDSFVSKDYLLNIDIDKTLKSPKYLAAYYTETYQPSKEGKDFIDLEDHNVVLSLSNIKLPGISKKEEKTREQQKKKEKLSAVVEEREEIDSTSTFYGLVAKNLSSYTWEIRHGAAQMLLGLFRGMRLREKDVLVTETLESAMFLHPLLQTLILDRFNDYEMDIALSPVRETIAKALQELYPFLSQAVSSEVLTLLAALGRYEEWQVKYSGLIGIRGILGSIDLDIPNALVKEIGEVCVDLLDDLDEDVKGMAASILTGLLSLYTKIKSTPPINIKTVISMCWNALAEEEDLAAAKSKIIHLLVVLMEQGHELEKITKDKYLSILHLLRNPIDTVRKSVLQMLMVLPVVSPMDALSSCMFSLLMETEEDISKDTRKVIEKVLSSSKDTPNKEKIKEIFSCILHVLTLSPSSGDSLKRLNSLIVIGETDICISDDGCKAAGEKRVLTGRANLFNCLLFLEQATSHLKEFFFNTQKETSFFVAFKGIFSLYMEEETRHLFLKEAQSKENIGDLNRGVFALVRLSLQKHTEEDIKILLYLFTTKRFIPILKEIGQALKYLVKRELSKSPSTRYDAFLFILIDAICAGEKDSQEEEPEQEVKRTKFSEDLPEEEPSSLLIPIEEMGDVFLKTEVFNTLKTTEKEKTVIFLSSTIKYFSNIEELFFCFSPAMNAFSFEIVSSLIQRSQEINEQFIIKMKDILEQLPSALDKDHKKCLIFLNQVIPSSKPTLLLLLLFPLIKVMNSTFYVSGVREAASKAFSSLVPFMHLKSKIECTDKELLLLVEKERERIETLHAPEDLSKLDIKVTLREYQKKGIEWLIFLKKSGLSGMLCDDMGLGKTIQALTFLSLEKQKSGRSPTLVLCPSALTGHWHAEISSFFPSLSSAKIEEYKEQDVCVCSYDKFRVNSNLFIETNWSYLILDEGHIIRNANTLLHARIKGIRAEYKILLSGTPIQNSVSELWALFDILMPGYLGTEKEFSSTYLRPILKGREGKGTLADIETAKRKLEELHEKVLPFILRRMKEAVLSDLPPKVITDVQVHLEALQRKAYEKIFAEDRRSSEYGEVSSNSKSFYYFSRLIKICSHLGVLADKDDPLQLTEAARKSAPSGKLLALIDLLKMVLSESKVLVFCQYKSTIDIISKIVEEAVPDQKWCRLDGTVKGDDRAALAKKFNNDPTLSIMYLTTHAGGLGLNLTGADVVIFYEHDWNPMMDLQAMDRAHRLGQKKSVSVFRLISKETIEESIMSLQNFKKYVASIVVNQQNVEIESMDTSNVLERFTKKKASEPQENKDEQYEDFI